MRMENRNHAETDTGNVEIESLERTAPRESVRSQLDTEDDTDLRVVKGGSWIPFRMVSRSAQGDVLATIASNRLVSGAVFTAGVALIVTFAVSLSRSASRPLPRPPDSMMCSGGGNGELPRISRAAFQHWTSMSAPPSENLVIMLGDGYGPQCHALARSVRRAASGNESYQLPLDAYLVGGSITSASSNVITDSAAGATAYAVGQKTFNGGIGVAPNQRLAPTENIDRVCGDSLGGTRQTAACGNATGEACCPLERLANTLEACRARGMATGIVVTTVLPHATPAAWSAHVASRRFYELIAQQQLEADPPVDVLLGGGRRYYDHRRSDGRNLLQQHSGRYILVQNARQLASQARAAPGKPMLGLFADEDMDYEIDRVHRSSQGSGGEVQPSLAEMVEVALGRLSAHERGFCLVVEGSRIDHGGHDNDAAAAAWDALAYNDAFASVVALTQGSAAGRGALVVSMADHSTGGLTLGLQTGSDRQGDWDIQYDQSEVCQKGDACKAQTVYPYGSTDGWHAQVIAGVKTSHTRLAGELCCNQQRRASVSDTASWLSTQMSFEPLPSDMEAIAAAQARLSADYECLEDQLRFAPAIPKGSACVVSVRRQLSLMLQRQARVGFTTLGHTSVDVQVFSAGSKRGLFAGMHENHEVGRRIREAVGLDDSLMNAITAALNLCRIPLIPP